MDSTSNLQSPTTPCGLDSTHLWSVLNRKSRPQSSKRTKDLIDLKMSSISSRIRMDHWKIMSLGMVCMVFPVRSMRNVQGTRIGLIMVFGLLFALQMDHMLVMNLYYLQLLNLHSYSKILLKVSHKHSGCRGLAHNVKDLDGFSVVSKRKLLKKGGSSGYGSHEVNKCGFRSQVLVLNVVLTVAPENGLFWHEIPPALSPPPMTEVLDALAESIPCATYDSWIVYLPEGTLRSMQVLMLRVNRENFLYAPSLLKSFAQMGPQGALNATKLLRPFLEIVDSLELKESFIQNWIDALAFLLAGVKSNGILSAEMVYMFAEWYKPGCSLEYPNHGTGAVVDALVCGLQKFGGRISFKSHVENIVVENGRAVGDTLDLLPKEVIPKSYQDRIKMTPQCESFMHLHLGFDAEGISEDSKIHHIAVNDWERGVDADQNVVLISIPSVLSPDLAPPGKHVLHAYMPGTEPFGLWEGLDRKSAEYKELKAKRSEVLWRAVERAVGPGFDREKNRGTYGPAIQAGKGTFPGHSTLIPQLYCCGDSTFPGMFVNIVYNVAATS
ncbi:unnamed protein product [Camellia sinensis]